MSEIDKSKKALDRVIKISRVHFYKPIQIAEILYYRRYPRTHVRGTLAEVICFGSGIHPRAHARGPLRTVDRTKDGLELDDIESYRNASKEWRDEVSVRLVGRRSTSSQKYQDNVFDQNAMPPNLLAILGEENKRNNGYVEAYIYKRMQYKLASVYRVWKYIQEATPETFDLRELVSFFTSDKSLRRSIDKIYEIAVYALFSTIVKTLKAQVTLEIKNEDKQIVKDFERFIKMVFGIDAENTKLILPASLYRVGVANAADTGLDMLGNFGVSIQVKHLTLTPEIVEDIAENMMAERIVIVCLDAEKDTIEALLQQIGWSEKIIGIITLAELDEWCRMCLDEKYRDNLGVQLLKYLRREFESEFPSSESIEPFMQEREYDRISFPVGWEPVS